MSNKVRVDKIKLKLNSKLIPHSQNNPFQLLPQLCSIRQGVIVVTPQPLLCKPWPPFTLVEPLNML